MAMRPFDEDLEQRALVNQMAPRRARARVEQPGMEPPVGARPNPAAPSAGLDQMGQGLGAAASEIAANQAGSPFKFQSDNQNGRGYLEEATRAYASHLQGIKDEGERETAVESYLKSLVPELQKRGLNVGDVRKEKMQIDGRWVDLYRDVTNGRGSGAAEAQWLEEDPNAQQAGPAGAMGAAGALSGPSNAALTDPGFFQKLMEQMRGRVGPASSDQQALLSLMQR